jgi:hypothetical protein
MIFSTLIEKYRLCFIVGRGDMNLDEAIRVHGQAFRSARAAGWENLPLFFD